jgi:ketosteroid isomerase-like protein
MNALVGLIMLAVAPGTATEPAVMCNMLAVPKTAETVVMAEKNWASALQSRNADSLACILAPEFKDTQWNGHVATREEILADIAKRPETKINLSALEVSIYGDVAVLHGVNTISGPKGKRFARIRFTDVFVYTGGKWKPVSAQETLLREAQTPGNQPSGH